MLCERTEITKTGPMRRPLGRGSMFKVYLEDLEPVVSALKREGWPIYEEPRDKWYRVGEDERGLHQLLVQDPDGYLVMFAQSLGRRPAPRTRKEP